MPFPGLGSAPCGRCLTVQAPLRLRDIIFNRPHRCGTVECAIIAAGPPDPPDYESPPEDWWVCSVCRGDQQVFVRQDWETGALDFAECPACRGTGWHEGKVWTEGFVVTDPDFSEAFRHRQALLTGEYQSTTE